MSLKKGDRIILIKDVNWRLCKGDEGTVLSYQGFGGHIIKFDKGDEKLVDESYFVKR